MTHTDKYMEFSCSMRGLKAVDRKGREIPKFMLFWHHNFRESEQVKTKFNLIERQPWKSQEKST
jgi:hypothetical protein